jgi:UDP:flavonoid glycosyltransferase YjiC (YdhE family)
VTESETRKRVLFVAEAITLAQVVRLVTLAQSLDPARYDVRFACGEFEPIAFLGTKLQPIPIFTIDRVKALRQVERGERIYEKDVLVRYVEDELALFERVQPDLVIGDFRLSLAISARRAGIPLASLINAYFSPHAVRDGFPLPDHPLVSLLGAERAARYFPKALPAVFARFVAPIDAVRKRYGIAQTGDLLQALCDGDYTLYPDVPELCPTHHLPANHLYLGHVGWSPRVPVPDFIRDRGERPLVYVTLGSSGRLSALDTALRVLSEFPVLTVVASAGRIELRSVPSNVRVATYVPGDTVAAQASVVVTNGGASTSYQALAAGTPVLGIPSNLDQYLAMTAIERAGAGRLVRSGEATDAALRRAYVEVAGSEDMRRAALGLKAVFGQGDSAQRFAQFVDTTLQSKTATDGYLARADPGSQV